MIKKVKDHIKRHKVAYSCGVTLVITAGITYIIMRESHAKLDAGMDWLEEASVDSLSFLNGHSIFGDITNNAVTTIHKGKQGHPGFVTRCIETGELFSTQGDAAKTFNIPEEFLSKHLNHGRELSENLHFERLGIFA